MTNEKNLLLSEAMGFLDDDFLIEAHPEVIGKPHNHTARRKTFFQLGLVACLCILALCIPKLPDIFGGMSDMVGNGAAPEANHSPEKDPQAPAPRLGHRVQGELGSILFTDETDTTVTLQMTLTKEATEPLYIYFYDYAGVAATTEPNYKNNGTVIREGRLKVTVNGQPIEGSLPQAVGTYEILIDFSALLKDGTPLDQRFSVTSFPELFRCLEGGSFSTQALYMSTEGGLRLYREGLADGEGQPDITDGKYDPDRYSLDVMQMILRIPLSHTPDEFPTGLWFALDNLSPSEVYALGRPLSVQEIGGDSYYHLNLTQEALTAGQYICIYFVFPAGTLWEPAFDPIKEVYPIDRMTLYLNDTSPDCRYRQQWVRGTEAKPFTEDGKESRS